MHRPIASGTPFLVAADTPQAESPVVVVDREVSTEPAKPTAVDIPLRQATPQSVEAGGYHLLIYTNSNLCVYIYMNVYMFVKT